MTRNEADVKLPEDGLGNKEFNERQPDWNGYDFAYKIVEVRKLAEPITLVELEREHRLAGPLKGVLVTPRSLKSKVRVVEQEMIDLELKETSRVASRRGLSDACVK